MKRRPRGALSLTCMHEALEVDLANGSVPKLHPLPAAVTEDCAKLELLNRER